MEIDTDFIMRHGFLCWSSEALEKAVKIIGEILKEREGK